MTNENKCRVCLADAAEHPIFTSVNTEESIYSKLCEIFKENIEDIDGYPQNICEKCKDLLHTVHYFITKYKRTCKILESSLTLVKKEVCTDNYLYSKILKQENEVDLVKDELDEPDSDWMEPLDVSILKMESQVKKPELNMTDIKVKLKRLKEINFKRKPIQKSEDGCKTGQIAAPILEAEFVCTKKSLKSSKLEEPHKTNQKGKQTDNKLELPKEVSPVLHLCEICGAVFKDNNKLISHKQRKHFNSPMKCSLCPHVSASKLALNEHIRRNHRTKAFICDSCGVRFAVRKDLNTHIKHVHLKIKRVPPKKKHICQKCDKAYPCAKFLIIHERSAHSGLRPAKCKVCNAGFYHEDYLKEHMRLHTGETPFKCPICGRGYAQRGNMKSHISHNHRLADLSPELIKSLKPSYLKILKKS